MAEHFISVKQASEQSGYSSSHIRNLLSKGVLDGQKFANVWMVDCQSLEAHKAAMALAVSSGLPSLTRMIS